jgi:hypothetical protein
LSALECGHSQPQIEAVGINNRGLRIALGAFCVCKTTNILCESDYENLTESRRRKLTNIALHVSENENHPVNKLLRDQEVYDEYAFRRKLYKPFFIRTQEACVTVECVKELEHPPWMNNNSDNMITQLMACQKGQDRSESVGIRAELETIIEEEGLRKYARVYTVGSVLEERSRCAIVMGHREAKIRLAGQMSIFNAEAQANIQAIKITRRWRVDKRILMTDSISNIVAQEETFTRGNSKKMVLKNLMAEEGSNLKLMWA